MKVEVAVLGSSSLVSPVVSVDVKQHSTSTNIQVQESRWPSWAPVPNKPTVSVDVKQHFNFVVSELRSCVKVEMSVLGSLSLVSPVVSVDVKQHSTNTNIAAERDLLGNISHQGETGLCTLQTARIQ